MTPYLSKNATQSILEPLKGCQVSPLICEVIWNQRYQLEPYRDILQWREMKKKHKNQYHKGVEPAPDTWYAVMVWDDIPDEKGVYWPTKRHSVHETLVEAQFVQDELNDNERISHENERTQE